MKQKINQLRTGAWTHSCGFFLCRLILVLLLRLSSRIYTDFLDSPDAAMKHILPVCSVGPEPGLYIILSQPVIGPRSLLRSSCRLFCLSLPIQLIRPPRVYSISLIRRKSRLFCSQPVTWKMRNKVLKQSVYLCLFFTHPSSIYPAPVLTRWLWWLHCSLPYSITYSFFSLCPHDICFITETVSCRLSSSGLTAGGSMMKSTSDMKKLERKIDPDE